MKLAVIAPLSGPYAVEGRGLERSTILAVEAARENGTLPRSVDVVSFDDRADPDAAADAARRAVQDPAVFAVIGPMTSACAIAAARTLSGDPMPMITPSATAAELTLQQERPAWRGARVVFRLPPSDAKQGDFDAEYARRRLGLRAFAVIHDAGPYGAGLADSFRRGFEAREGRIAFVAQVAAGDQDFSPLARRLAAEHPDGVFYGGMYFEAARLLRQARAAGFIGVFMSGDGAKSDGFFQLAGDAADGAYVSIGGPLVDALPGIQDFIDRYRKRWDGELPRTLDHYAFVAAQTALWAMRKTGGDRRKAIDAIRSTPHETMMGTFIFDARGDSLKSLVTMTKADARQRRFEPAY